MVLQPGPGREGEPRVPGVHPENRTRWVLYLHGFTQICIPVCKESSWERATMTTEFCVLDY